MRVAVGGLTALGGAGVGGAVGGGGGGVRGAVGGWGRGGVRGAVDGRCGGRGGWAETGGGGRGAGCCGGRGGGRGRRALTRTRALSRTGAFRRWRGRAGAAARCGWAETGRGVLRGLAARRLVRGPGRWLGRLSHQRYLVAGSRPPSGSPAVPWVITPRNGADRDALPRGPWSVGRGTLSTIDHPCRTRRPLPRAQGRTGA
ncbi:hypothetical protein STTU_3911 [Streptomyces sp. Tu6071]|nr:hypothetical protein STTU_3911 [Streptomyces sp. Tu6071]